MNEINVVDEDEIPLNLNEIADVVLENTGISDIDLSVLGNDEFTEIDSFITVE